MYNELETIMTAEMTEKEMDAMAEFYQFKAVLEEAVLNHRAEGLALVSGPPMETGDHEMNSEEMLDAIAIEEAQALERGEMTDSELDARWAEIYEMESNSLEYFAY